MVKRWATRWAPSAVTFLGHLATLAWLTWGGWWLAGLGLAADALDGRLARRLGVAGWFGREYDWLVDTSVAALVVWEVLGRVPAAAALLVLVPAQAALRTRGLRVSGRAAVVAGALLVGFR